MSIVVCVSDATGSVRYNCTNACAHLLAAVGPPQRAVHHVRYSYADFEIKLLAKDSFTREGEFHKSVGASGRAGALVNSARILAARVLPGILEWLLSRMRQRMRWLTAVHSDSVPF